MSNIDELINNIKKRNKNKDVNSLPLAIDIINEKFFGLESLKNKLKNCYYINSNTFFIPSDYILYYINKDDPLFILHCAGKSKSFNLINQTVTTKILKLNINDVYLFIQNH